MPSGVPSRTAARKRSPVATIGVPSRFDSRGAWVPFPAPGAPRRTMAFMRPWPPPRRRSSDEPLVLADEELRLELLHRLDDDADDDQDARAAEGEALELRLDQGNERRQGRNDAEEQRAGHGDPGHDAGEVVLRRASRPDDRDEAAVLAELLGRLVG